MSGSPITVAKGEDRRVLCDAQSRRAIAAYLYTAAGQGESTTDLAWDGHLQAFEYGEELGQSSRFADGPQMLSVDIDVERLAQERRRVGTFLRWGLVPAFAQGVPGTYATHNARIETVRSAPAFRTAWQRGQRCLVIAQGFYEWQVVEGGKQPWYIACADQPTFAFAGLWDQSRAADGEPLLSCTVLTLPASPLMAGIHNTKQREPAILRREDHEAWLTGTADAAWACLRSYPDELRSAWPVSRRVNVASNDDLALIDPLALPAD
jgi:putative SOS response-associated peptidase YedK